MGDKQPSIRTLSTGEKVMHYPDGTQRLIPVNRLADRLSGRQVDIDAASVAQTEARLSVVEAKREAQAAGDAVPNEKSPL